MLQLGSAEPTRAVQVANLVQDDVAAIDVNMGCPKDYSVKGGCGAALLEDPARAASILRGLVNACDRIPVTCKMRVLPDEEQTFAFARRMAETGIAALAVHGRLRNERSTGATNRNELIHRIFDTLDANNVAFIANGGSIDMVKSYEDIEPFRKATGAHSVMLARAALLNPAIFCSDESKFLRECSLLNDVTLRSSEAECPSFDKLQLETVIGLYIAKAIEFANPFTLTKYTIQRILREQLEDTRGAALRDKVFDSANHASTYDELVKIWRGYLPQLDAVLERYRSNQLEIAGVVLPSPDEAGNGALPSNGDAAETDDQTPAAKRARVASEAESLATSNGDSTVRMAVRFFQKFYDKQRTPKERLHIHCSKNRWPQPVYNTVQDAQKYFRSSVTVNGVRYESTYADKSKKSIEHSAACVCLRSLGESDGYLGGS